MKKEVILILLLFTNCIVSTSQSITFDSNYVAIPMEDFLDVDYGDVNTDGTTDLLVITECGVSVYYNLGNFTFSDIATCLIDSMAVGNAEFLDIENDGDRAQVRFDQLN